MQFFEHQDQARGRTALLVSLFVFSVLALGGLAAGTVHLVLAAGNEPGEPPSGNHWSLVATTAIGTWGVILLGSAYRTAQLSQGGKKVAETLGGYPIAPTTEDLLQRRIINIVEEMALAAGLPVPPVYLLPYEKGINAFAAGWSPDDAVIGITQGALESLKRDQLQGVIAHEFSHILNRDCSLNMRLMGVLHGIVVISIIGRIVMRMGSSSRHSSTRREGGAIQIFLVGLAIWAFGSIGVLVAHVIQSAVSRQREFLADASAVQFTRNPDGIAGALATIGSQTSALDSPRGSETSHMLISDPGGASFLSSLSSHPPLFERISRILPRWSGNFDEIATPPGSVLASLRPSPEVRQRSYLSHFGKSPEAVAEAVVTAGLLLDPVEPSVPPPPPEHTPSNPSAPSTLDRARSLLAGLPSDLREAAETPFSCRALIVALALDQDRHARGAASARGGLPLLSESPTLSADANLCAETARLLPRVERLPLPARLPLFDLALPTFAQFSDRQTATFLRQLEDLKRRLSDRAFGAYCLVSLTLRHLDPAEKQHKVKPILIKDAIETALSVLAHQGHDTSSEAADAFSSGLVHLGRRGAQLILIAPDELTVTGLDSALKTLLRLPENTRARILTAAHAIAENDGRLRPSEAELLRTFALSLNISTPPESAA